MCLFKLSHRGLDLFHAILDLADLGAGNLSGSIPTLLHSVEGCARLSIVSGREKGFGLGENLELDNQVALILGFVALKLFVLRGINSVTGCLETLPESVCLRLRKTRTALPAAMVRAGP